MKLYSIKSILMVMIIGLVLQSCSKEETDIVDSTEEFRGGSKGNSNGNNSVANINNDLLNEWTDLLLVLDRYATGMRPNATARALAYINLAAYETAVPGMKEHGSTQSNFDLLTINQNEVPRGLNYELALNACYADVIDHFILNLPSEQREKIEELEEKKEDRLSRNVRERTVEESIEWGEYVAKRIIEFSETDLEAEEQILAPQPSTYEPPTGEGYWTYSADPERALFPYWKSVRTFVIAPEETTTVPPIEYSEQSGSAYFAEMMEVYNVNNEAKEEQGEDLWIAEFWSDDVEGLMMSPPGRQISIANQLVDKYKLNLEESLTLFVKLGFSLNDAAVSTWKYKYDYMVMRPSVFIHDHIDADYQTNLYRLVYWPNPSFPGYPSGHSCFASAAGGVFIDFFGDNTNFTDRSHEGRTEFLGSPRKFNSFSEMADENAFSRIPLGVHIRMDCVEGVRLGYEISDAVNALDLDKNPL